MQLVKFPLDLTLKKAMKTKMTYVQLSKAKFPKKEFNQVIELISSNKILVQIKIIRVASLNLQRK